MRKEFSRMRAGGALWTALFIYFVSLLGEYEYETGLLLQTTATRNQCSPLDISHKIKMSTPNSILLAGASQDQLAQGLQALGLEDPEAASRALLRSLPPSCSRCMKILEPPLLRCGKCRKAAYCSRECQKVHWSVHKKECNSEMPGPSIIEAVWCEDRSKLLPPANNPFKCLCLGLAVKELSRCGKSKDEAKKLGILLVEIWNKYKYSSGRPRK